MADEILPKSRTQLDHESFTRDDNSKVARRVTDDVTHDKLDAVISSLGGSADTNPTIYNVAVATANTEVSQVLPANTKRFIVRSRNRSTLKIAYISGESGVNYVTLRPGAVFEDSNFYSTITIYFQSDVDGETVEVIAYT